MLSIACLSQKGGVGKSTFSRLMAVAYAANGWRVKIADFNTKQKTSTDWSAMRMSAGIEPEVAAEAFTTIKNAIRQAPQYDLMVFDGRPDSDTSTLDIAKEAKLIVVPTGVTLDDLAPQVRFAHELAARGIPEERMFFVINKTIESAVAIADARSYIRGAGYACSENDLPVRTGYQIAQNSGRAVCETTFTSLNDRALSIAHEIVGRVENLK